MTLGMLGQLFIGFLVHFFTYEQGGGKQKRQKDICPTPGGLGNIYDITVLFGCG